MQRISDVTAGPSEESFTGEAHGRVNLIGEHTDYNGGWVLPTTIPGKTIVTVQPKRGTTVFVTTQLGATPRTGGRPESGAYELGEEHPLKSWIDYLQGATKILAAGGHRLAGMDVRIESSVPVGSGLSSSAALEVSFLKALRVAFELNLTDKELALVGQRIENEFVGARVGIMDQMACALARHGEALFLDTMTLGYERLPLPMNMMDLIIINSGVVHRNSGGDYNRRRAECEEACRMLGVTQLRELEPEDLPRLSTLPDVLRRRATHVITENQRVKDAVESIRGQNLQKLGELFVQSHISMRDDYEVSIPEIDILVELCCAQPGVFGARMTGGGFGGSIVAVSHRGASASVAPRVVEEYLRRTGQRATILLSHADQSF